ncbi:MAG: hypothetical protein RIF32_08445 [Leptospirales bacterium]
MVGILPAEATTDDSSLFLLAALRSDESPASTVIPVTPDPALVNTAVLLYTGANSDGNYLNGQATARLGADLTCQANRPVFSPDNSCLTIHALISLTATDEIRDMVANYGVPTDRPIQGPTGGVVAQIATNWTDLLNGGTPLSQNLQTAGITTARWRSFANADGSLSAQNCGGGTNGASGGGQYGDIDTTGTQWISDSFQLCSEAVRLVCVCY